MFQSLLRLVPPRGSGCEVGAMLARWVKESSSGPAVRIRWRQHYGKRMRGGHLGRTNDAFLGVEHVPRKSGLQGGWEINKLVEAKALLIKERMKNRVGHFGVYSGLKFEGDV